MSPGLAFGFLDTGCNILTMRLHSQSSLPPYLQSLHFFFGVGALLAPLLIHSIGYPTAFYAMSSFAIITAVPLLFTPPPPATPEPPPTTLNPTSKSPFPKIAFLTGLFLFLYVGSEVTVGGFLTTLTVTSYPASVSTGQLITSLYWGTLTLGRLLAIPLSTALSPPTILALNILGCTLTSLTISLSPTLNTLWYGTALFGLAMASSFPTAINLAQSYIPVTGRVMGYVNVMACMGEVAIPVAAAWMLKNGVFVECIAGLSVAQGVVVGLLVREGRRGGEGHFRMEDEEEGAEQDRKL